MRKNRRTEVPYIKIKPGVDMSGLSPKIWEVAFSVAEIFDQFV
jgi:hypothetical protein